MEKVSVQKIKMHFRNKRKTAVASCRFQNDSNSQIIVNGKSFADYFKTIHFCQLKANKVLEYGAKKTFFVKVTGGGISGQLDATISSIASSIVSFDPQLKAKLKEERLLVFDSRIHERCKPGKSKRRKSEPYNKR